MNSAPHVTIETPIGPDVDLDADEVFTVLGQRLTYDDVAEFVADAHRGAGRPSLTAAGAHSPQVTVRLPAGLLERLDAEASREGLRRSALVRRVLEEHLRAS